MAATNKGRPQGPGAGAGPAGQGYGGSSRGIRKVWRRYDGCGSALIYWPVGPSYRYTAIHQLTFFLERVKGRGCRRPDSYGAEPAVVGSVGVHPLTLLLGA